MRHQNISVTGSLNLNGVGVATTANLNAFTASSDTKVNALIAKTGSYAVTGSNTFTGAQIVQGTLTAQTLVVQTVTSSVLYTTGSNIIGSSLSNVQQLTGSVGITGSLAINGTGAIVGSGTANFVPKFTASGTIGNSALFQSGNNLGLGTTSPVGDGTVLNLYGSTASTLKLQTAASGTTITDGGEIVMYDSDLIIKNREAGIIQFATTGTERMRIDSAGNVGIGTTTPSATLHIVKALGNDVIAIGESGNNMRFRIGQEASYTGNYIQSTNIDLKLMSYLSGGTGGNIIFQTGASDIGSLTERMRLTSGGLIIINSGFNNFQTSTKTASSGGNTTFAYGTDYGKGLGDNTAGIVIINISQTNANVTNPSAVWIGTVINPRGSGATITQISTTKGSGISTVSVSGNISNEIIVNASTSDGSNYRASMTFIGGGGVS